MSLEVELFGGLLERAIRSFDEPSPGSFVSIADDGDHAGRAGADAVEELDFRLLGHTCHYLA